jgi:hypothetical protein
VDKRLASSCPVFRTAAFLSVWLLNQSVERTGRKWLNSATRYPHYAKFRSLQSRGKIAIIKHSARFVSIRRTYAVPVARYPLHGKEKQLLRAHNHFTRCLACSCPVLMPFIALICTAVSQRVVYGSAVVCEFHPRALDLYMCFHSFQFILRPWMRYKYILRPFKVFNIQES